MQSDWTNVLLPVIVIGVLLYGAVHRVKMYDSFLHGVKDGFGLLKEVFPSILGMFFLVKMITSCGLIEDLSMVVSSIWEEGTFLGDLLPMMLFRPISGSASIAVLDDICSQGADSFSCKAASAIQGSTDTTLYVLSLYFSSVGIKKWKHALKSGLIADVAGMGIAVILSLLFLQS